MSTAIHAQCHKHHIFSEEKRQFVQFDFTSEVEKLTPSF